MAAIFRLENAQSHHDVLDVISNLTDWLKDPEQNRLRRSFVVWIKRVLMPAKTEEQLALDINSLEEINHMLSENVQEWNQQWIQQGLEQGLEQEKILLYRLINKRFGKNVQHLARLKIQKTYSPKSLETIGDWIIDCKTGEEFMNNLSSLIDDKTNV